ncbi:MAG TPA: tetratricopeptide repeat protein, partial [Candidatus Acidoferrum sp.]|nr:tetratricopeptide repeat protein [Candidatus Acidoferrum sp.]
MLNRGKPALAVLLLACTAFAATNKVKQDADLDAGRRAYEDSDYARAILALQTAAAKDPKNGDIELLLAKSYLELQERDAAVHSAEKAVEL